MSAEKSKFWHLIKNNLEEIYIDIDSDKNIAFLVFRFFYSGIQFIQN